MNDDETREFLMTKSKKELAEMLVGMINGLLELQKGLADLKTCMKKM